MLEKKSFCYDLTCDLVFSNQSKQVQLRLLCGKSDPPRPPFAFKAGQWVDFYIQGMKRCGGYSMVSAPESLPQLTLAVKGGSVIRSDQRRKSKQASCIQVN